MKIKTHAVFRTFRTCVGNFADSIQFHNSNVYVFVDPCMLARPLLGIRFYCREVQW